MWGSRDRNDQDSVSLRQGYYQILGRFKENQIPIVGYISNTHSQAVTNSLRLLLSERPQLTLLDFEGGPGPTKTKPARGKQKGKLTGIAGVQDADLYRQVLSPGHYSEVFQTAFSEPKELTTYIDQVCFLYWRTDNEIVRLEFPLWVVEKGLIPAAMSLVQDQNRRGQGYPVALMEAHESAVLRPGDRELLRILLEENGLLQPESEKGRSKRLRGI
jgi:GNAT superfamily N-acetyltransferase